MTALEPSITGMPDDVGRLPDPTLPLIGRDAELADLRRALTASESRLLTLTGPPGVGKTRLALEAAHAVARQFADGVVFVDLSPVRDPALVIAEVGRALGLGDAPGGSLLGRVVNAVAEKTILLVVDNCEQVLAAGPDLAAPLRTCAGLRLLVTSRERLHLGAEHEIPLLPLTTPGPADAVDPARLAGVPAVALLVARMRGTQPDFAVTPANAAAIREICLRLDGLPLALELTAARAKLFTPGELATRLRHRISLLTTNVRDAPDRHRTLRAALEWSHELLDPHERALFRRLSVFVGPWTLAAVEQVCADGEFDILETVGSLVDKSLVRRSASSGDVAVFGMLESLREYATEQLAAHDDVGVTRDRHATYFAGLAAEQEGRIGLRAEREWWSRPTAADHANLHTALDHCLLTGRAPETLQIATALGWHAYFRGHLGTGRDQVRRALETFPGARPDQDLAAALVIAGVLAWSLNDLDEADALLGRSLAISDAAGDVRRAAIASSFLGHSARAAGRYGQASDRHRYASELYRRIPSPAGYAWTRYDLGLLAYRQGDLDEAGRLLDDGLATFREIDYGWAVGHCARALAGVRLRRGEIDEAAALLAEALMRHDEAGDGRGLARCLAAAAEVASARGLPDIAARLLGAAAERRRRLAAPLPDEDRDAHDGVVKAVRRVLGHDRADRSWALGRDMSAVAAVGMARSALTEPGPTPVPHRHGTLTGREQQVADLIAGGRTNRQIGRTLGISEKTVEAHVHHVIAKLGARSRTEVAAWVLTGRRNPLDDSPDTPS
jgi:predicted ATPase/DNA-binding CsgD family transcriptional regulator